MREVIGEEGDESPIEDELSKLTLNVVEKVDELSFIKIYAYYKKRKLSLLVDGSSLNFLDVKIAKGLGYEFNSSRSIEVVLADDTTLLTHV